MVNNQEVSFIVVERLESDELVNNTIQSVTLESVNITNSEIKDYFGPIPQGMKRVILSHNDIAGIQMGAFLSKEGFSLNDIDENCDLFINGHIHNCGWVSEKAFNIGNLTGQNFSEDAFRFEHVAVILDTDTLHMDWYENPHAFNFYKIDLGFTVFYK